MGSLNILSPSHKKGAWGASSSLLHDYQGSMGMRDVDHITAVMMLEESGAGGGPRQAICVFQASLCDN
jgi:hypothetical protein